METQDKGYTGYKWTGSKYQRGKDVAEIAKEIRIQIKEAIRENTLPQGSYSVTIERFAGGRAINIKIKAFEFPMFNPAWLDAEMRGEERQMPNCERLSKVARLAREKLKSMLDAYRYDDSDGMIDYFDTNFYAHVDFDWQLERAERDAFEAAKRSA